MGLQGKINAGLAKLNRKLFDNEVHLSGNSFKVSRVRITEDKYGNEYDTIVLKNDIIECIVDFPAELPLFRKRFGGSESDYGIDINASESTTGTFFFEILPIEIWVKWKDKVEKGDFLIFKIKDDYENDLKVLFQITDTLGSFHTHLIWRKCWLALYNGQIDPKIQEIYDNF